MQKHGEVIKMGKKVRKNLRLYRPFERLNFLGRLGKAVGSLVLCTGGVWLCTARVVYSTWLGIVALFTLAYPRTPLP